MDKDQLTRLLSELKQGLLELYGERFIDLILFGSYARGDNEDDSDIDVALILDDFEDHYKEIKRTGQLVSDLSLKNDVVVALLNIRQRDWNGNELTVIQNIHDDGIRV